MQHGPDRYNIFSFATPDFPFDIGEKVQLYSDQHTHDAYEFFYVVSGSARHICEGRLERISAGDLVFLDLEQRHGFPDNDPKKLRIINCLFLPEMFSGSGASDAHSILTNFQPGNSAISLRGGARTAVTEALTRMLEEYRDKKFGYQQAITGLLQYFFTIVARSRIAEVSQDAPPARGNIDAVYDICRHIDANFAKDISFKSLAKTAGLNYSYLSSLFHRAVGRTFREYLLQKRLEEAKLLLRTSPRDITSVCYDCGFSDLANFGRHFKRYTGMTPGAYRLLYISAGVSPSMHKKRQRYGGKNDLR